MGALTGITVIELAGIGPAPMAGMLLADMGADVIRVERGGASDPRTRGAVSFRGKQSVVIDLKSAAGVAVLLRMVEQADVLIDPFRPGVTEKLGVGPDACFKRNPRLVYGRMTGWGQEGPLAQVAGHDINYIALTGALHAIGTRDSKPVVPLNLVGDMGAGGMLLVQGILAALLERHQSGEGQVIDAAMVDGTAQSMWMIHGFAAAGDWDVEHRGVNFLDGGAHFYDTYRTADDKYIAIGAIEPQFYKLLLELCELDSDAFGAQMDQSQWPALKARLAELFSSRTRDQWCALLEGSDVCFAPVLSLDEAPGYPHNVARQTYIEVDDVVQPAPAPRFSRTPSSVRHGAHRPGEDTSRVLRTMGFSTEEIAALRGDGFIS